MNYSQLNTTEKANITKLINARKALDKAQREYEKMVEKNFSTIKEYGTIQKEYAKISYTPNSEYITLDTTRLKAEKPELLTEYGKTVARKESVRVVL